MGTPQVAQWVDPVCSIPTLRQATDGGDSRPEDSGVGIYPKHPFKIVIFPFFLPFPPFFLLSSFYLARVKKGFSAPACNRISDIIEERPA